VVKPVDMAALVATVTRAGRTPRQTDHETGPSPERRMTSLAASR